MILNPIMYYFFPLNTKAVNAKMACKSSGRRNSQLIEFRHCTLNYFFISLHQFFPHLCPSYTLHIFWWIPIIFKYSTFPIEFLLSFVPRLINDRKANLEMALGTQAQIHSFIHGMCTEFLLCQDIRAAAKSSAMSDSVPP